MAKEFKLVPAEIPGKQARGGTLYSSILGEFAKSAEKSVRVEVANRKPATVTLGLRTAIKASKVKMAVLQRGTEIYLQKK